jgi:hypothetical protein
MDIRIQCWDFDRVCKKKIMKSANVVGHVWNENHKKLNMAEIGYNWLFLHGCGLVVVMFGQKTWCFLLGR